MRNAVRLLPLGLLCLFVAPLTASERPSPKALEQAPVFLREQLALPTFAPAPSRDGGNWQDRIDSIWGPGLPTSSKLAVFDSYWSKLDQDFACFQDLDVDWNALLESAIE